MLLFAGGARTRVRPWHVVHTAGFGSTFRSEGMILLIEIVYEGTVSIRCVLQTEVPVSALG